MLNLYYNIKRTENNFPPVGGWGSESVVPHSMKGWNLLRRLVGEGHRGRWVVMQGGKVIGVGDKIPDAYADAEKTRGEQAIANGLDITHGTMLVPVPSGESLYVENDGGVS